MANDEHSPQWLAAVLVALTAATLTQSGTVVAAQDPGYRQQAPLYSDLHPEAKSEPAAEEKEAEAALQVKEFTSRYVQADSPRVIVFWGNRLSDRASERVDSVEHVTEADLELNGEVPEGKVDVTGHAEERSRVERRKRDQARQWHTTETEAVVRSAFEERLLQAGVRLVDRDVAVRLQGTSDDPDMDYQRLEMETVKGHADWLVEVLAINTDSQAPRYRVRVRDVDTALVLSTLTNVSMPETEGEAETVWQASERGGYEQVEIQAPERSRSQRGKWLAEETMRQLTRAHSAWSD